MASDIGSRTPGLRSPIRPLPVDSPTPACDRNPEQFLQRGSLRVKPA